ncbi:MAG: caspase family protein [Alphaproteobacteria bacterium]|nr:caspase family protein [Alphaproteobacteria bacterium]
MHTGRLNMPCRLIALAVALVGMGGVAIAAHAALNGARSDASAPAPVSARSDSARLALVIGNSDYPDAEAPLAHPVNDARALAAVLRRGGFDVDQLENADRKEFDRALRRLRARIRPDSVVLLFFGGYAVQSGEESFLIPVDAVIWKESDVRRQGVAIGAVLDMIRQQGARARLLVVDASRRNPYERRFRFYSHGLAPIKAAENALVLSANAPNRAVSDPDGPHSVLVGEFLRSLATQVSAETIFNSTRFGVSRISGGGQNPAMSSSLGEDIELGPVVGNAG